MQLRLANALAELDERTLIDEVIFPLIEELHPGRIEFTHSAVEAGRDLVSFGSDALRRRHYLCVQVKTTHLPSGGGFTAALSQANTARKVGITTESGEQIRPHEVWFITSKPFAEEKRRQVAGAIQDLERENIKLIAGEELASLVLRELPDIARNVAKYSNVQAVKVIAQLLDHREGRAFGIVNERRLDEFYVATTLSPHARLAYHFLAENLDIEYEPRLAVSVSDLIGREPNRCWRLFASDVTNWKELCTRLRAGQKQPEGTTGRIIWENLRGDATYWVRQIADREHLKDNHRIIDALNELLAGRILASTRKRSRKILDEYLPDLFAPKFTGVHIDQTVWKELYDALAKGCELPTPLLDLLRNAKPRLKKDIEEQMYEASDGTAYISVPISIPWEAALKKLKKHARSSLNLCPRELGKDVTHIHSACRVLDDLERTLQKLVQFGMNMEPTTEIAEILRIRVLHPEHLVALADALLIEGPPGCGKTTLLKMLTIKLLDKDERVIFLPCSAIDPSWSDRPLQEIAQQFGHGVTRKNRRKKGLILVIDGLDEAPFDLTDHILKERASGCRIVASVRPALEIGLRSDCLRIGLALFSKDERNAFFANWFRNRDGQFQRAKDLIHAYEDIDNHTRLPLIATIAAALIENGLSPRTREEVYSFRLDLLISKWDRARGVQRLRLDDPDAKRRAIRELAFQIHSAKTRRRSFTFSEIQDAFYDSLGRWASQKRVDDLVHDLVLGSGIIVKQRAEMFSFGHLTFQEHLVGEYLARNLPVKDVVRFIGDDWWREPLGFYASIVGSLDEFLAQLMVQHVHYRMYAEQLRAMSTNAPYTSDGALQIIGASPAPRA
ncbi:MAG: NACHT domain-containing protein [Phycisphaerales bacterium]|nr:NACHT domain-containing protein [Phycisphaerales bacterium]